MSKQIKLKQFGDSSKFTISKYQVNSDTWETVLEIERDKAEKAYLIKNQEQTFVVYDKSEQISKIEKILGRDSQKNKNRVVMKESAYNFLEEIFKGTDFVTNFENNEDIYSMTSVSSGTKGTICPINKNSVPIAVFSQSNLKVNGRFQLELSVADLATDEDTNNIILLYVAEYIAIHNLSKVGLLSLNATIFYAFNGRKTLTKEHLDMMPLEKRPTKFEAFSWYYAAIPLLYSFISIKLVHTLQPILIGLGCMGILYLLILGMVVLSKHMKGSK